MGKKSYNPSPFCIFQLFNLSSFSINKNTHNKNSDSVNPCSQKFLPVYPHHCPTSVNNTHTNAILRTINLKWPQDNFLPKDESPAYTNQGSKISYSMSFSWGIWLEMMHECIRANTVCDKSRKSTKSVFWTQFYCSLVENMEGHLIFSFSIKWGWKDLSSRSQILLIMKWDLKHFVRYDRGNS